MTTKRLLIGILGLSLGLGFTTPSWAAPAVVEKGEGVLNIEEEFFQECFGEVLHSIGTIPYTYHRVQLPNGKYVYHDLWLNPTFVAVGLDTGTIWTLAKNVSPFIDRTTGGGMTHFTAMGTWVSDAGEKIELRNVFHVSYDANGNLKVDRLEIRCREGN